jgi:hypothetical protein
VWLQIPAQATCLQLIQPAGVGPTRLSLYAVTARAKKVRFRFVSREGFAHPGYKPLTTTEFSTGKLCPNNQVAPGFTKES